MYQEDKHVFIASSSITDSSAPKDLKIGASSFFRVCCGDQSRAYKV